MADSPLKKPSPVDYSTERLKSAVERLEAIINEKTFSASNLSLKDAKLASAERENQILRAQLEKTTTKLDKIIEKIEIVISK